MGKVKYGVKINEHYLRDIIYPEDGSNKRTIHLIREPHYYSDSTILGKLVVLLNIIDSGDVEINKFEVEAVKC